VHLYTTLLNTCNIRDVVKESSGPADIWDMTITSTPRALRKALTISGCFLTLFLLVAPAAHAGALDGVTNQGTTVVPPILEGDTSGSAEGDAPAEQGSGLGGAVAGVVTTITESGASVTTNVVEEAEKTVGENGGPVKQTLEQIGKTADDASAAVTAAAAQTENTVRQAADKIVNHGPDGKHGRTPSGNAVTKVAKDGSAPEVEVLAVTFADALRRDAEAPVLSSNSAFVQPPGDSLVSQVGRIAAEAAKQMAFPMLLTLLVVGFLFAQNRIDRSDPKLALAPVESDHDLLSFT
jgi:hypothetical protein